MAVDENDILSRVKILSQRRPVYTEMLDWMGNLLLETVKASREKTPEIVFAPDMEAARESIRRGRSLFTPENVPLDATHIRLTWRKLLERVKRSSKESPPLEKIEHLVDDDAECRNLIIAALGNDEETLKKALAMETGAPQLLMVLLRLAARPSLLELARRVVEKINLDEWRLGHCPVCGSFPRLGHLSREGGRLVLYCPLCDTKWNYPRLRCPFCENQDTKTLHLLQPEGEKELRVYICSGCRNYYKTIDLREAAGPVIGPLDDMAGMHLDLLAGHRLENDGP